MLMFESNLLPILNPHEGEILSESEKVKKLIENFRNNWQNRIDYENSNILQLKYKNYNCFTADINNLQKFAEISNIYPNSNKTSKLEILKDILIGLYFLVEEMLNRNVSELKTVYTNLKMAKSLRHICNCGNVKVCVKVENPQTGKIEKNWQNLEAIDFLKLNENLQSGKSFEGMTATFDCLVDQDLLEHLKTKIAKLHKKELLKL